MKKYASEECVYSKEYLRPDEIASGSTDQADRRLNDVSKGRQCAFMSLSAMLLKRANSCRVSQWTTGTVYEILIGEICHICESL